LIEVMYCTRLNNWISLKDVIPNKQFEIVFIINKFQRKNRFFGIRVFKKYYQISVNLCHMNTRVLKCQ